MRAALRSDWVHFSGGPYDAQVRRIDPNLRRLKVIVAPAKANVSLLTSEGLLPVENKHRVGEYELVADRWGYRWGLWRGVNN